MIRAPGAVVVLIFHVGVPGRVPDVPQSVLRLHQLPLVVFLAKRHAGIAVSHADLLPIIGERPRPVTVVDDRPHVRGAVPAQGAVGPHGHVGAFVVVTVIGARQGLPVGRVIDDHFLPVCDGGLRVGGAGVLSLCLVESQGEHALAARADIIVRAPVVFGVIPLHVGIPDGIADIPQAVLRLHQLPLVVLLAKRHAGEIVPHADLLPVIGERPRPVTVVDDRPHVRGAVPAQGAVGPHGHVGAVVVVFSIGGRQGLPVGGVVDDHFLPVRDGGLRVGGAGLFRAAAL